MKVGVTIPAADLAPRRERSLAAMVDQVVEAERLGYDSAWVMDHVFTERAGVRAPTGPDPLILLALAAARSGRIELGTLVLCAPFRAPAQLAREAKALAEASGDRFILGLGAGWHQPEFDAFGYPFDHLVGRFEEYLEVLTRLLGDSPGDYSGAYQRLAGGQVFGRALAAPWVAGFGPRMLRLAGRLAGGWNSAWHGPDPALFRERLDAVEAALAEAGRPRSALVASAGIFVLPVEGEELERLAERLSMAPSELRDRAVTGSPERVVELLQKYREAGCDHAILNFAPAPFRSSDDSLAGRLTPFLDRLR